MKSTRGDHEIHVFFMGCLTIYLPSVDRERVDIDQCFTKP